MTTIRRRLTFLDTGLGVTSQVISPDGKQLALTASVGGQTNIYVYPLVRDARMRLCRAFVR